MSSGILTLTTDFGDGPYVASMKGVVLGLAPGTQLVDVSHSVSPQNIAEGSFLLASILDSFPEGTVHLAVVDPGVGTDRRVIALRAAGQWFVLPDNGLISEVLRNHEPSEIRQVTHPDWRSKQVSMTFHGRDIMAPAAAHLLNGGDPSRFGPAVTEVVRLARLDPTEDEAGIIGLIVYRDSFGNLISNVTRDRLGRSDWRIEMAGQRIEKIVSTYADGPPGSLVALIGSSNFLEVAVVNGSAADRLGVGPGTPIRLHRRQEPLAR